MLLVGMNSWIQSSANKTPSQAVPSPKRPARYPGVLRAGIATALVALTLLIGFGRPVETAAYPKSESTTCNAIDTGARWVGDRMIAAQRAGDTKGLEYWSSVLASLESLYFGMECQYSYSAH